MIESPGIYTIPSEEYHADPCPAPSLSSSIAKALIQDTPWHAWTRHPLLNPDYVEEEAGNMDIGSICHGLLLEGVSKAHLIRARNKEGEIVTNFMTKAAKEERDEARRQGFYPILQKDWIKAQAMVSAARAQLDVRKDAKNAFTGGKPEQTLIWQEENGVWCRVRPDWLHDSMLLIDDYKTRSGSAHPDAIERTMFREGWHIQAAFYLRGVAMVTGVEAPRRFRFVCHEIDPPFALSVVELHEWALAVATKMVVHAIETFGTCLQSGIWPGYPLTTHQAVMPEWMENGWNEREVSGHG